MERRTLAAWIAGDHAGGDARWRRQTSRKPRRIAAGSCSWRSLALLFAAARVFEGIRGGSPRDGCLDRKGNYWIGPTDGGLILSLNNGRTGPVALPGEGPRPGIRSLIQDREGNIWIGGTAGLYRIRQKLIQTWTDAHGSLPGAMRSLAQDGNLRLWFVQENRVGWLTEKTNALSVIPFDAATLTAGRVASARDGAIWLGVGDRSEKRCELALDAGRFATRGPVAVRFRGGHPRVKNRRTLGRHLQRTVPSRARGFCEDQAPC